MCIYTTTSWFYKKKCNFWPLSLIQLEISTLYCIITYLFQQLAALLIARQVIGNLKESALPYLLEQMRLAKLSFDLWGALSPTGSRSPPGTEQSSQESDKLPEEEETKTDQPKNDEQDQASAKRTISQAELESSLFKVKF